MNYEYIELNDGERQYDDYDLEETNTVKARYVKSNIQEDNGNPYIEALPYPRDKMEVYRTYNKRLSGYDYEKELQLKQHEKLASILRLRKIRYMLPFHVQLEEDFYTALLSSYRERKCVLNKTDELKIVMNDEEVTVHNRLLGKNGAATNAGLTLLGHSGCGKSASLEILLSNYPQVIIHTNESEKIIRFTQITYLTVVCPANSNFSALYVSIGAEIDKALGNIIPVYETMVSKAKGGLAGKAEIVCKLIQQFGIGCLIFDEIQLIDFVGQKDGTFESLLTIVNKTKVALVAIGTKDAYSKMFPNLRTSRRTGAFIDANSYCEDKKYFSVIVSNLMKYQWFDEYVEPTKEIISALYDVTKGIIDQLISVYIYMQLDYLRANKKPEINAEYIRKISNKYYPGVEKLLADIENPLSEIEYERIKAEHEAKINELINEAAQLNARDLFINTMESIEEANRDTIRNSIINNLTNTFKITGDVYNISKIERAVDHIMNINKKDCTEEELTQKAFKWLKKNSSDKRPNTKKKAVMDDKHIAIRNMLEDNKKQL